VFTSSTIGSVLKGAGLTRRYIRRRFWFPIGVGDGSERKKAATKLSKEKKMLDRTSFKLDIERNGLMIEL
jgi:hypothetical protein